ncbi:MAG: prepilin-type N-terminal cleavage/methylation domain-containing protein [Candidatus Omnitrophota bacterium]|nr:prepilin-type N-terminal cleavage/methylation domain-containing protein [Candidatus Omnitrophota bacterium]
MTRAERGVTLLEVMIASAIAAVIAIGLTVVEGMRARTTEEIRRRAGLMEPERKNAALAAVHIAKAIETADRFNLDPATGVYQLRLPVHPATNPPPGYFDAPANYEWRQYRLTGNELRLYRQRAGEPCPAAQVLAREIAALTIDEDPPPNANRVTYSVTWDNGPRDQTFQGRVITRFRPNAGIQWGLQNPASATDVSPPPGACP